MTQAPTAANRPQTIQPSEVPAAFQQAQALQRAGQWAASEPILRAIEASIPRNPAVCAALAHNAKQRGDLATAETLLREAVALAPQEGAFLNNLASTLLAMERAPEAKHFLTLALRQNPTFADAIYNMGRVHEEMQEPDPALAHFVQYTSLAPQDHKGYVRQMAHLVHREDFHGALAVWQAAQARGIETYDLVYYSGCALAGLSRHEEALAAHHRAMALAPKRWEARKGAANAKFILKREDEALDELFAIATEFPEQLSVHYEHSSRAWSMGRKDLYLKSYDTLRARNQMTPDHYTTAAQLMIRADNVPGAIALMEEALRAAPGHSDVLGMMGACLSHTPDAEGATRAFEASLRADPRNILTLQNYGYMCLSTHRHREAIPLFEQMLAIDPKNQMALAGAGLAYRETGDARGERLFDYDRFVRPFEIRLPPGFASAEAFNRILAEELTGLHTQQDAPVDQTLRGGTQTTGNLFSKRQGAVAALHDMLRLSIAEYLAGLPDDPDHPFLNRKTRDFKFSGSWSCRLKDGGYHTNHVHNMGWISSAYYVQVPPEVGQAQAEKQGWISFGQSNLKAGTKDVAEHFVQPVVGRLVLFPSYFWHGTLPFESGTARMTVAFDAIPA
jgi:tetratricopeptide (TPR) repeat protein